MTSIAWANRSSAGKPGCARSSSARTPPNGRCWKGSSEARGARLVRRHHPELRRATAHEIDHGLDTFGIGTQGPDDQLLGLEVRIRADRNVRKALLELLHQRVEACFHCERVAKLAHGRGRAFG